MEPNIITPADYMRGLLDDYLSVAALIRQVLDSTLPLAELAKGAALLIAVDIDEPFAPETVADVLIELPEWPEWIARVAEKFDDGELIYETISEDTERAEIVARTTLTGHSCVKITLHSHLACVKVRFT